MLAHLLKAAVGAVIVTPVAMLADVPRLMDICCDDKKSHTAEVLRGVVKNVKESVK